MRTQEIWKQQEVAIEYARSRGLVVENVQYMWNRIPAMKVKDGCYVVFGESLFKFGSGTARPLAREISPEEMEEIIYLAKAYMGRGVHGMLQVVLCAEANNRNEVVFDREAFALEDGSFPEDMSPLDYRKKYFREMGMEWHRIGDRMRKQLEGLVR